MSAAHPWDVRLFYSGATRLLHIIDMAVDTADPDTEQSQK